MINIDEQNIILEKYGIEVVVLCGVGEAVALHINNKYYILIDADVDDIKKYWMIQHELSHIIHKTMYDKSTDDFRVNQLEIETNDKMILRCQLPSQVLELQNKGLKQAEICDFLQIPIDIYNYVINYIERGKLEYYEKLCKSIMFKG